MCRLQILTLTSSWEPSNAEVEDILARHAEYTVGTYEKFPDQAEYDEDDFEEVERTL
jgi:hypothetical protein